VEKILLCNSNHASIGGTAGEVKYIFIKCQRKVRKISTIKGLIWEVIQNQYNDFAVVNKICGILYFVDLASRYKFLVTNNLTHFFIFLFISCLYMFRASQRSS